MIISKSGNYRSYKSSSPFLICDDSLGSTVKLLKLLVLFVCTEV